MKRLIAAALSIIALLPSVALAQTTGESISSFDVRARLEQDRTLTVTEHIMYQFGDNEKHGIYRDIPVRYDRNGGSYRLRITVDRVQMDSQDEPYETSMEGDNLRIKIGDAHTFVTGQRTYDITYHTDRAVNFFDDAGELYWNVTGNGWEVPIASASFQLTGPDAAASGTVRTACYTGPFGSTATDCTIAQSSGQIVYQTTDALNAEDGFTIVAGFPAGAVTQPPWYQTLLDLIRDNGILLLPVLVFGVMFWLWSAYGRDPKGRGTVIPQYEPPRGLSPAEMAGLKEQDVPQRAVTATILDLARHGYLKIDFGEEKGLFSASQTYTFIKSKDADASMTDADREIFDGVFARGNMVALSDLKGRFYRSIKPFKNDVLSSLKEKGFFDANPAVVRGRYIGFAVALGAFTIWIVGPIMGGLATFSLIASAIIIAGFGWFMPRPTEEGAAALEEVEGFKWFLSVTEKDRLAFHDAPKVKPSQFHEFLPAAIAFGVEKEWAEQFRGLDVPPPSYATGSILNNWAALNFISSINRMNTVAAASAYAPPSSAGRGMSGFSGGGSGGGFGGGGGGSW